MWFIKSNFKLKKIKTLIWKLLLTPSSKWVWLIKNQVLRVQLVFVWFKSSRNQTGFNWRKPRNRFGRLTWARDRSIPKTRPIDRSGIELLWLNNLGLVDQYMLRIFSLFWIYLSRLAGSDRMVVYRIDRSLWEFFFWNFRFFWGILKKFLNYFS